jgi:hypothetical protein
MYQGLAFDLQQTLRIWEQDQLDISLCTITRRPSPPVTDALGQVDMTVAAYTTVLLSNIACQLGVWRLKPDLAAVTRMEDRYDTLTERHCLLDGYFPQILQRDLATVDGIVYEIMAVESDSQHILTRLALRTFVV